MKNKINFPYIKKEYKEMKIKNKITGNEVTCYNKGFDLSECREVFDDDEGYMDIGYWEEDVKEFIRLLKKELKKENSTNPDVNAIISRGQVIEIINRLAGEKLK